MSLTADPRYNPFPLYAQMRATSPVFFNPERKVWLVYGYDEIRTIMSDPVTFSSRIVADPDRVSMATMDPPEHTRQRNLMSRAFTPKAVADLEPRIEALAHELLDQVIEAGQMDMIADFASPLPVTVIAELLGVPLADRDQFREWADLEVMFAEAIRSGVEPAPHTVEGTMALSRYLEQLCIERKAHPRADLISNMVVANAEREQFPMRELAKIAKIVLVAGFETTINLIGNAVYTLLEHPESLAHLRAEPQLIPSAIEEVLRYRAPAQFSARIPTRDVELGGQLIPAGQFIMIFMGSGNRDPRAFADPDRFDITRSPNPQLGFGHGLHFCLGAPLARLEGRVALTAILQRLADLRLAEGDDAIEVLPSTIIYGLRRLRVRFTPGARLG